MKMFGTMRGLRLPLLFAWVGFGVVITSGKVIYNSHERTGQQILQYDIEDVQTPILETPNTHSFHELLNALDVLQEDYFAIWQGIWPTSIDWTSAVIGTYLSSALTTLSTSFPSLESSKYAENIVNKYFSQLVASYFGQDAFSLRQEAYDDMLWVVLGWIESIKFINTHSALHYGTTSGKAGTWHGEQWIPAFAHRARIFWDMASQGWDTKLCNGGMIWSPYLAPYKNAITNELYIAASISMYLYFPGDKNTSPFGFTTPKESAIDEPTPPHDPKYLAAAIEAYRWLNDSNMTDTKGLYVDGYHISGWSREKSKNSSQNTRCDARNEMVYTYNQGVLLSGQRGLYEATGAKSYLEDGHQLISDVIHATGWNLKGGSFADSDVPRGKLGKWQGLGRSGILEEACDAPGFCTQDAQTFKGIFFHHLTNFCARLPEHLVLPGGFFVGKDIPGGLEEVKKWHDEMCATYAGWIKHNAKAALTTVNTEGRFGMWWGAPPHSNSELDFEVILPDQAVDYRNQGVPSDWKEKEKYRRNIEQKNGDFSSYNRGIRTTDLNDRGRGRTVETQGGGISVLRAMWEIVDTR